MWSTFNIKETVCFFRRHPVQGALWGLFAVSIILFFKAMPIYVDDFWYARRLRPWIEGAPSAGSLLDAVMQTWRFHYLTDNARLPNVLIVPLLLLPKWVGSLPAALALCYAFAKGSLMAVQRSSLLCLSVGLLMFAYCIPWYDCMGSEDYQLNYAVAVWLAMWGSAAFLRSRPNTKRGLAGAFVLGLILGLWHEGFSVPVLVAAICLMLSKPPLRSRFNITLLVGISAGLCVLLTCPGLATRLPSTRELFTPSRFLFIAICHPAFLTACVVVAIVGVRRGVKFISSDPVALFMLISACVSMCIHLLTTRLPRTGFWAETAAILLILNLLSRCCARSNWGEKWKALRVAIVAVTLTLAFIHQGCLAWYSFVVSGEFRRAVQIYSSRQNPGPIFMTFTTEHDAPLAVWFAPDFNLFTGRVNRQLVEEYYHPEENSEFLVIPSELENVTASSGSKLPGSLGARSIGGHLFMPLTDSIAADFAMRTEMVAEEYGRQPQQLPVTALNLRSGEFYASIDFGPVRKNNTRIFFLPFISKADNRPYVYLYPWRAIIEYRISSPRAIDINPAEF